MEQDQTDVIETPHAGREVREVREREVDPAPRATEVRHTTVPRTDMDRVESVAYDPYEGHRLYNQTCGKCHTLFGQGGKIGPDLTTYKRDDLRGMLLNVVNPSAEIREGFENYIARTADGRTIAGLIADQDPNVVVIRGADGQNISLQREEIEDLRASRTSLMPDGQLKPMSDQQIRDLFAYLRSTQPLADRN